MTAEEEANLALVKAAYAAADEGDFDKVFLHATEETELHQAASLPYGGVYRGVKGIKRGARLLFAAWDDFATQVLGYAASGDQVFVQIITSATGRATGKSFSMPITEVWRLRDGKIVEIRPFYYDTARVAECFG